jgi:hypothetical protein
MTLLLIMHYQVTFRQLKDTFDEYKSSVPKIEDSDFKVLWMDDYYDGMLVGMLEYENRKFRYEIISDFTENIRPRVFAIIELTQKQIDEELYWNNLFKKYVGNHNNFDSDEKLVQQPQTMHHFFYDKYKQRQEPNYDLNIVKGWFTQ